MDQEKTQEKIIQHPPELSIGENNKHVKNIYPKIGLIIIAIFIIVGVGSAAFYFRTKPSSVKKNIIPNTSTMPTITEINRIGYANEIATIVSLGGYYKDPITKTTPATNSAEFYSFKTGKWEFMPPMNQTRAGAGVAVLSNKVYVFGGQEGNIYHGTNTVEMFDPITNTWEFKKNMPHRRFNIQALPLLGKIYVLGGMSVNLETLTSTIDDKTVDVYDPVLDSWSTAADIPITQGFYGQGCAIVSNKMYCPFLGEHTYTLVYDPITNLWSSLPTQNRAYGNGIWIELGYKMYSPGFTLKKNEIVEYTPLADSMSVKSIGYYIHPSYQAYGAVAVNQNLILVGGKFSGAPVRDVYISRIDDPQPWKKTMPLNLARASAATIVLPFIYSGNLPSPNDASIGGLITESGKPASNIKVMLELNRFAATTTTLTDQNGRYIFTNLKPGKYSIGVEQQTHPGAFSIPMYKNSQQYVDVNEGDKIEDYNYNLRDGF